MICSANLIAARLKSQAKKCKEDPLAITPLPDLEELSKSGSASIDLRLGTWFATMRQSRVPALVVEDEISAVTEKANLDKAQIETLKEFLPVKSTEENLVKMHYVPFGGRFILHPGNFVLGVTLEWIRLPRDLAGYVIGKSSWGRRGLIIATAAGVHPGFTGCLTLELSNCNEIPIVIKPGMEICQLFLHYVDSKLKIVECSSHAFSRKPHLGKIKIDAVAKKLGQARQF